MQKRQLCEQPFQPLLERLEDRIVPAMDPFVEPTVIQSVGGVLTATLTQSIGTATVGDTVVTNAWRYNGAYVGPTLVADPGDTLDITIVNQLGQPTNLHTHGMHVSPLGNADNVFLSIEPGESNRYTIEIPDDHPEGLYWYHPHRHGFVNEQIVMGLSGVLVIGRPDGGAIELDGLIQHVVALKNAQIEGNELVVPEEGDHDTQTFTVNGQLNPVLTMQPGEWRVLNIANIGNDAFYKLEIVDTSNPSVGLELLPVAKDGNPFTVVGNPQQDANFIVGSAPGMRWSILFQAGSVGAEYQLNTLGFGGPGQTPGSFDTTNVWPAATLMTIQVAGAPWVPPPGFVDPSLGSPLTPPNNFYRDLRGIPDSEIAAFRTVEFGDNGTFDLINGQPFPNNPIFKPRLNTVEEWTLTNVTEEDHPFHLHTNPQQVKTAPGGIGAAGLPLYQDIIMVPAGRTVVIRIEFLDFLGRIVYHCHRVDHEDHGMMAMVAIIPSDPIYAIGANQGTLPSVGVFSPVTGTQMAEFFAYDPTFQGGVNVAVADVNGDSFYDIITGAGIGGAPHVKVIDGTKLDQIDPNGVISDSALLGSFFAFNPVFPGGVFVAAGDINSDGKQDVILGAGPGAGPLVKVVDANLLNLLLPNGEIDPAALLASFFAYEPAFIGGVRVAADDIAGNGRTEIITGAGPGGPPVVQVIDGTKLDQLLPNGQIADSAIYASFYAYAFDFTGGVFVATGSIKGWAFPDIIVGPGVGSAPLVKIYTNIFSIHNHHSHSSLNIHQVDSFMAYDPGYTGGVRVSSMESIAPVTPFNSNRDHVVTTRATGLLSDLQVFSRDIDPPPLDRTSRWNYSIYYRPTRRFGVSPFGTLSVLAAPSIQTQQQPDNDVSIALPREPGIEITASSNNRLAASLPVDHIVNVPWWDEEFTEPPVGPFLRHLARRDIDSFFALLFGIEDRNHLV